MDVVDGRAREVEILKPSGAQETVSESQMSDTGLSILLDFLFCFDLVVTVSLFSPLGKRI